MSVDHVTSSSASDALGQTPAAQAATPPPPPPTPAPPPETSNTADRDNPILVNRQA